MNTGLVYVSSYVWLDFTIISYLSLRRIKRRSIGVTTKHTIVAVVTGISTFMPRREIRARNTSREYEASSAIRDLHLRGTIPRNIPDSRVGRSEKRARSPAIFDCQLRRRFHGGYRATWSAARGVKLTPNERELKYLFYHRCKYRCAVL